MPQKEQIMIWNELFTKTYIFLYLISEYLFTSRIKYKQFLENSDSIRDAVP